MNDVHLLDGMWGRPKPTSLRALGAFAPCLAVAVSFALSACSPPPGSGHFPLEAGRSWTYEQRTEWENQTRETETLTLRNLGQDSRLASGSAMHRRSDSGMDYWLRADDKGIFRVASKHDLEEEPKADATPRFVLKSPLVVGTTWQATTTAYVLRRRADFPPEIRHSHPAVPMTYVIESIDAKVNTTAGAFEHCLQVKGSAVIKLFADPVIGWQNMPLTTLEWYCPGVGLVRVERQEPANSTFLMGGSQILDLQTWQ